MFTVELKGEQELSVRLDSMPAVVRAALEVKIHDLAIMLQGYIISQKLHGQVLKQRSGALARSIQEQSPITEGDKVSARVYSSGDVKYARIQELGGTIKHPGGTAYFIEKFNWSIQSAQGSGLAVFLKNSDPRAQNASRTKPHDIKIPARPYMRPSLAENAAKITKDIKTAAIQAIQARSA